MASSSSSTAADPYYPDPPLIANSELHHQEYHEQLVETLRKAYFKELVDEHKGRPEGGVHEQWFRRVAQLGPTAIRRSITNNRTEGRLIVWKKGVPFGEDALFFRTVDTSRVLPLALGDFRVQWYYSDSTLKWLQSKKSKDNPEPVDFWLHCHLMGMMLDLCVIRGMHDYGCGDVPIILLNWTDEMLDKAIDFWVELSKGRYCKNGRRDQTIRIHQSFGHHDPCFNQVDLLVRALWSDKKVEYVPRFIVFQLQGKKNAKTRVLFTDPSFVPPPELVASYPRDCGKVGCTDSNCGYVDFDKLRSLAGPCDIVRRDKFPYKTVRCNYWICKKVEEEGSTKPCPFMKCERCREVLYCGRDHQVADWKAHKVFCEKQAKA